MEGSEEKDIQDGKVGSTLKTLNKDFDLGDEHYTLLERIFLFILPFLISAVFITWLYLILPWDTFQQVGAGITAYFFPPLGKETVIPSLVTFLSLNSNLSDQAIIFLPAACIAFVDIIVGFFLLWNFDLALKIPLFGALIRKVEKAGEERLKNSNWIRRLALVGIALFVIVPFQGSGGVGATIVGRMLGLNKYKVWGAIIVGAFVGCFTFAIISFYVGRAILDAFSAYGWVIGGALMLLVIGYIITNYRRKLRNGKPGDSE